MKVDGKSIVKSCLGRDKRTVRRTISSYWKCRFCEKEMAKAGVGQLMKHWHMTHWRESGYRHQKKRDKESKFRTCPVQGCQAGVVSGFPGTYLHRFALQRHLLKGHTMAELLTAGVEVYRFSEQLAPKQKREVVAALVSHGYVVRGAQ